jgi:hypothetical protein
VVLFTKCDLSHFQFKRMITFLQSPVCGAHRGALQVGRLCGRLAVAVYGGERKGMKNFWSFSLIGPWNSRAKQIKNEIFWI